MEGRFEKQLLQCKSLDEFVTMFFGLSKQQQMSVLGDEIRIPKGTRLYRARKYEGIPLTHENDWWLPPACQAAHCGRGKSHFIFGGLASPIVPYRNLTQTTDGITADCRSLV